MSRAQSARAARGRQTYWDWRAAGNFMLGGSGAGVLLYVAVCGGRLLELLGAALVGAGLLCVWLEIGRPWRALNVFRHPATSWMSREAAVAPLLLAGALAAVWLNLSWLRWLAAGLAVTYVYCQARMLNAGRGIPAWRNPRTVPLMVTTGLAEGAGLAVFASGLSGPMPRAWLTLPLAVFVLARALAFRSYRRTLASSGVHQRVLRESSRFGRVLSGLYALVIAVVITGVAGVRIAPLVAVSALIAAGLGWWLKYTLVIRWSYEQPFTVPVRVARGGQPARPGPLPGG